MCNGQFKFYSGGKMYLKKFPQNKLPQKKLPQNQPRNTIHTYWNLFSRLFLGNFVLKKFFEVIFLGKFFF